MKINTLLSFLRRRGSSEKSGFTLTELLVVVAIVGILASVAVVSLNSARAKDRDTKRIVDIGEIKSALALYYESHQSYPVAISAIDSEFLASIPMPPALNEAYYYAVSQDGLKYHLGALLEQTVRNTGVLINDKDCNSSIVDSCSKGPAYKNAFDGKDPIYDVTQ